MLETLTDLALKAKVYMALAGDQRFDMSELKIGVENGLVILRGHADTPTYREDAQRVALSVPGVSEVRNLLTTGGRHAADSADELEAHLLQKLDAEWNVLPSRNSLAAADYLRWGLWTVYKFHIPPHIEEPNLSRREEEARERAIEALANRVGVPKVLLAVQMLALADDARDPARPAAPETAPPAPATSPQTDSGHAPRETAAA